MEEEEWRLWISSPHPYASPLTNMNYAIIGCGRISPNHLMAAKENNLNIVALCDLIPASHGR